MAAFVTLKDVVKEYKMGEVTITAAGGVNYLAFYFRDIWIVLCHRLDYRRAHGAGRQSVAGRLGHL